jgi:hypothetical protein
MNTKFVRLDCYSPSGDQIGSIKLIVSSMLRRVLAGSTVIVENIQQVEEQLCAGSSPEDINFAIVIRNSGWKSSSRSEVEHPTTGMPSGTPGGRYWEHMPYIRWHLLRGFK